MSNWREIKGKNVKCYQLGEEPEVFYVIPLYKDEFLIVHIDAWDYKTGETERLSSEQIKEKYKIDISI
jgi:hypothetical protein